MKIWILLSSISLAIATLFSPGFAAALSPESAVHFEDGVEYMPNVIVVAFAPEKAPLAPVLQNGVAITGINEVDELNRLFEAVEMRQLFPGAEKHGEIEMAGYYSITFRNGPALISLLEAYDVLDIIDHVEPDGIHPVHYDPNDPMLPQQWAIAKIEATSAWDITQGSPDIVLGIPDTGVDWDHPDLEADVWQNEAEVNGTPGVDDDDNDYVDDFRGWDWVTGGYLCDQGGGEDCNTPDNNPMDRAGHGSHVGGIASAVTDNGVGIAGLGFNCKIMPLRIGWLATNGGGYVGMSFAASAFYYATNNGAVGVNCSWGSSNSGGLGTATTYAVNNGLIVISAAGNNNNQSPSYLCGRSDVVSVAATNSSDQKASFSSYGTWVDISAPGVSIRSTVWNNSYANYDGTSMAAPHVLGLAGLIWSAEPLLPTDDVISRIYDTADNIDDLNPGYERMLGSGRINAYAALASMTMPNIEIAGQELTITDGDGDGVLNPGESFDLVVSLNNNWADAENVSGILRSTDVFTVTDSIASFGNIGHNEMSDNSDSPFSVSVDSDALLDSYPITLEISADGYETTLEMIVDVSLNQTGFPMEIAGQIESSPLIFDVNLDGENELIFGANDDKIYVIESDGEIAPGWPQSVTGDAISAPAVGDLAAVGTYQVVAVSKSGLVYAWNADGSSYPNFPVSLGGLYFSGVMLLDIDGDSDLEIVTGSFSDNSIYALHHDGSEVEGWPYVGSGKYYGTPVSGDIDGDNLSEVVCAGFDSLVSVIDADGSMLEGFPVNVGAMVWPSTAVGDIDGDQQPEIVAVTATGDVYLINHDGSIVDGFPAPLGTLLRSSPSLGDLDGDGYPEMIFGGNDQMLYVLKGDGTHLTGFPQETDNSITSSPVIGDISGDGQPDIIVGTNGGMLFGYASDGNLLGNFPIAGQTNGQIVASPALGDLDGDGDMEIVVGYKGIGYNLVVIDYKQDASTADLAWPFLGKDIWRSGNMSDVVTSADDEIVQPIEFGLKQNYPNPFNAKTTIQFSLTSRGEVELSVFDLLGRNINVLNSGVLNAGVHSMVWDGTNKTGDVVASGIYFYRLSSPDGPETRRMLLLK